MTFFLNRLVVLPSRGRRAVEHRFDSRPVILAVGTGQLHPEGGDARLQFVEFFDWGSSIASRSCLHPNGSPVARFTTLEMVALATEKPVICASYQRFFISGS